MFLTGGLALALFNKPVPSPELPERISKPERSAEDPAQALARLELLLKDPSGRAPELREAIEVIDTLLKTFPEYAYGLRLKANLYVLLRDYPAATQAFQTYLDQVPTDAHARLCLVQAWSKLGAYQNALKEGDYLYERHPQFINLLRVLQRIHEDMGHTERAVHFQKELLKAQQNGQKPEQPTRIYHPKNPTE